jgi:hypothetical protein
VDYNVHLWHTAYQSTWDAIIDRMNFSIGVAVSVFTVVLGLSWLMLSGGSSSPALAAFLLAFVALALCYTAALLAHLGYYTPRKLLFEKQKQLLEERSRFGTAITALETRLLSESTDRVAASLDKLLALLKARHFTHPIAGLYEAGVAELEPPELDDLCRQLTKRQIAHPFADVPGGAEYWMWLLQSSVERGVRLSTQKDVVDYHEAVQLELAQDETDTTTPPPAHPEIKPASTPVQAPAPTSAATSVPAPGPKPASSTSPKAKAKAAATP